jgi:hypothetical protein
LNCDTPLTGKFCRECGQSASVARYRFASLGGELYDQLRKVDIGRTAKTIWALLRRPGGFVRGYLAGKRVGYLAPIKYFFYSFVVQMLFGEFAFWLTHDRTFSGFAKIDLRLEVVTLASTVFWGILWALIYRRSKLNTVENVVAAIYFVAQVNFLATASEMVLLPFGAIASAIRENSGIIEVLLTMGYSFYFAGTLFNERILLLIPKQAFLTALYVTLLFFLVFGDALLRAVSRDVPLPT